MDDLHNEPRISFPILWTDGSSAAQPEKGLSVTHRLWQLIASHFRQFGGGA